MRNTPLVTPKSPHSDVKFEAEYSQSGEDWKDVLAVLPSSTSDVRVLLFNSDTTSGLDGDDLSWERPDRR